VTKVRALVLLAAAAASQACVMPEDINQIRQDIADVQRKIEASNKAQADLQGKVTAIDQKIGSGDVVKRSDVADLQARLDEVTRQTTASNEKLNDVSARVDKLSQDVSLAKESARRSTPAPAPGGVTDPEPSLSPPGAVPAPKAGTGTIPNPNALYTSAYADFSKGNYALAVSGFEEYAERFPESELADNAMYWIGECKFSQGDSKAAVDAFDAMLAKYPKSDKAAAANLKKALAFLQLNQVGPGVEQLRYVVATYPGTDEARIAKDRLASLGKP
jgi:tol-pal system protein YbgF